MSILLALVLGYVLGAIPSGLIVGRLSGDVDLRQHGSGRTGTTNALRTLGARAAGLVFVLDVAKGIVAVILARLLFSGDPLVEWAAAAAGVAAIVGHNWSVFIGFTGGRGVATLIGAMAAMSPWTVAILLPIGLLIIWRTRYVSLGSVVGAIGAPVITAILATLGAASVPAVAYALAAGLLVTMAHADNIERLRAGTERRIGKKGQVGSGG
jgi:glycerol-3-phosphate acyltransferase PlsY